MASINHDEAFLVTASKEGNQDAFSLLIQRYQQFVFNLVLYLLQDYREASDITQEAFLIAWQRLSYPRGKFRFSTWLYRIAYNCALKRLKLNMRDRTLRQTYKTERPPENTKDEQKNTKMEILVQEYLFQLPTKYRVVLIFHYLQSMTYEDISEVLAISIGTVKTRLFHARNILKEYLIDSQGLGG